MPKKITKQTTPKPPETQEQVIRQALYKKAMGYTSQEIIEEYVTEDNNLVLSKRKVTSKEIPPDIPAVKTLIELMGVKDDFSDMSDEDLIKERDKLLQLLQQSKENSNE